MTETSSPCTCRRCSLLADVHAAREDETLSRKEREEFIQDARADLDRAPVCPRARPAFETLLRAGVEAYLERPVDGLEVVEDPRVENAWALRAATPDGPVDFLLSAGERAPRTAGEVVEQLEEAEFATWPPRSGRLRFFR